MHKLIFIMMTFCLITTGTIVNAEETDTGTRGGIGGVFDEFERQIIKKYFDENRYAHQVDDDSHENEEEGKRKGNSKSKGKRKNKGLPPGIAKNLKRGKPLPPGIAKRDLPDDLESSLPDRDDGYERTVVGDDVVLVEIDTGEIADIIKGAVLGI